MQIAAKTLETFKCKFCTAICMHCSSAFNFQYSFFQTVGSHNARLLAPLLLEPVAIHVIADDVLATMAASRHAVDRTGVPDSESSWHPSMGSLRPTQGKRKTRNLGWPDSSPDARQ
jgi:hypothetical protein